MPNAFHHPPSSTCLLSILIAVGTMNTIQAQHPVVCRLPSLEAQAARPIGMRVTTGTQTGALSAVLSGVPEGFDIANLSYAAWRLDGAMGPSEGETRPVTLWFSYGPLPEGWRTVPWDKINHLLNHGAGLPSDMQQALWRLAGITAPLSATAQAMVRETEANGPGFVPEPGQKSAVLAEAGPSQPAMVLEIPLPLPLPVCPVLDFLWDDRNRDGTNDAGEPAIVGATVVLMDCAGHPLGSAITQAGGFFSFDLPAHSMPRDFRVFLAGRTNFTQPTGLLGSFSRDGFTPCFLMSADCKWRMLPPARRFRTFTAGAWGAPPHGRNPGWLLERHFPSLYGQTGLAIGGAKVMRFTSARSAARFLRARGKSQPTASPRIPVRRSEFGDLAVQVLALRLNVDFSRAGITPPGLGGLKLARGLPMAGRTVDQVLELAEQALETGRPALPAGMGVPDLHRLLARLNAAGGTGAETRPLKF